VPQELVKEELREILGYSSSPEVPPEVLARDAKLMAGMHVGHRLNRHVFHYGLKAGYQALGEAVDAPWVKDYADVLSRTTTAVISTILLLFLRGQWPRILTFGVAFESYEGLIDEGIEAIEAALAGS